MRTVDLLITPASRFLQNARALGIVVVVWICGLGIVVADGGRLEMAESKSGEPSKITIMGFQQTFLTSTALDESLANPQIEESKERTSDQHTYFLRIGPNIHPVTGCGNGDTLWGLLGRWPAPVYQQEWDSLLAHENLQARPELSCDSNRAIDITEGQVYLDDTKHRLLIPTGVKGQKEFYAIPVECGYDFADGLFRVERRYVSDKVPDEMERGNIIELRCGAPGRTSAEYRLYFDVHPDKGGNERNVLTLTYETEGTVEAQLSFCRLGGTPLNVIDKDILKTRLDVLRKYLNIDTALSPFPFRDYRPNLGCFNLCVDDGCSELADIDFAPLPKPEIARALSPTGVGLWGARASDEQRMVWFEQCASGDGFLKRFLGVDTTGGDEVWTIQLDERDEQHPRRFLSLQNEGLASAPAGFFRCPQKVERKRLARDEYSFVELQSFLETKKPEANILELVIDHQIKIIAKGPRGKDLLEINDRVPYDEIRIVGESVGGNVEPSIIFDLNCDQGEAEICQAGQNYTPIELCCGKRLEFHHLTVSTENFFQVNSNQKSYGIVSNGAVAVLNHATLLLDEFRTGLLIKNSLIFCDHCKLHAKVRLLDATTSGIFAAGSPDDQVHFKATVQPNDDDFSVHLHDTTAIFSAVNIKTGSRLFAVSGSTRALSQSSAFTLGKGATEAFKIDEMGGFTLEPGKDSNTFYDLPRGGKFSLLSGNGKLTIDTESKFFHLDNNQSNVWDVLTCKDKKNGKLYFRGKNRCEK